MTIDTLKKELQEVEKQIEYIQPDMDIVFKTFPWIYSWWFGKASQRDRIRARKFANKQIEKWFFSKDVLDRADSMDSLYSKRAKLELAIKQELYTQYIKLK